MDDEVDEFLAHFGVTGMKWGHRKGGIEGVPSKTNRLAAKDAKEHALAKMYYGEGAGVRRRQIKNVVETRKKDPAYAKAFDHHLSNQDLAKASSKAHSKRKRTDVVKGTTKTAKGIHHILNGNAQYASATAALLVGGAMYAHKAGIDKMLLDKGKTLISDLKSTKSQKLPGDFEEQIKNFKG
jgi:hypothetical protein